MTTRYRDLSESAIIEKYGMAYQSNVSSRDEQRGACNTHETELPSKYTSDDGTGSESCNSLNDAGIKTSMAAHFKL